MRKKADAPCPLEQPKVVRREAGASALVQKPGAQAPSAAEQRKADEEAYEICKELGRRHLIDMIKFCHPVGFEAGWFHELLAETLEQFVDDCYNKKNPRLIIMAPPRHGKSEEASRYAPAYAFGKYPDMKIIATSHGATLAESMNRDIQRIIDGAEYEELFPNTRLFGKNIRTVADGSYLRNSDIFEIVNHRGVYKNAGIGGTVMGSGAQMILVDDPVKDSEEAQSETIREKTWDWFTGTLYHRVENGGGILVIMTRWHADDLVGRLLEREKEGGEHWDVVCFPAIAEEDEYHPRTKALLRHKGDALHPERIPLEMLERIKMGTGGKPGTGSRVFTALFQQRPSLESGNYFKRENWVFVKPPKPVAEMSRQERLAYFRQLGVTRVIQTWDTALGGKKKNDYAACATVACTPTKNYLVDLWMDKVAFSDVLEQVKMLYDKWTPNSVCVEGGGSASGKATVNLLSRSTSIPFKETITCTDKEFRAGACEPTHEAKLCCLFEGNDFNAKFVDNCANFPNIKNDDDVDAWMLAIEEINGGPKNFQFSPELLAALGAGGRR